MYGLATSTTVESLRLFLPLAMAAYEPNETALKARLSADPRTAAFQVRGHPDLGGTSTTPAHFVSTVQGASQKLCVVSIRGTESVTIAIKHTLAEPKELPGLAYRAHGRMTEAAMLLMNALQATLQEYHSDGYRIVLTGHSLGGAAAAILGIVMKQNKDPIPLDVYTFAAPPCVETALAETCSDYVTSVVSGDDMVPRLSAYSTAELSHQLSTLEWPRIIDGEWWSHMT